MASFKIDCLLLTVPRVSPTAPIIAPALLKSHLKRHGFTSKVIDYNIRLYNDIVDVSGTLETNKKKDLTKIRKFLLKVKEINENRTV